MALTIGLLVLVLVAVAGLVFVTAKMIEMLQSNAKTSDDRLRQWDEFSQNWSDDHREHRLAVLAADRAHPELVGSRSVQSTPAPSESSFRPPTFDDPTNPG